MISQVTDCKPLLWCAVVQDTTNSMYGFAKLFHHPCNNLPGIVALYALRHWHRCDLPFLQDGLATCIKLAGQMKRFWDVQNALAQLARFVEQADLCRELLSLLAPASTHIGRHTSSRQPAWSKVF